MDEALNAIAALLHTRLKGEYEIKTKGHELQAKGPDHEFRLTLKQSPTKTVILYHAPDKLSLPSEELPSDPAELSLARLHEVVDGLAKHVTGDREAHKNANQGITLPAKHHKQPEKAPAKHHKHHKPIEPGPMGEGAKADVGMPPMQGGMPPDNDPLGPQLNQVMPPGGPLPLPGPLVGPPAQPQLPPPGPQQPQTAGNPTPAQLPLPQATVPLPGLPAPPPQPGAPGAVTSSKRRALMATKTTLTTGDLPASGDGTAVDDVTVVTAALHRIANTTKSATLSGELRRIASILTPAPAVDNPRTVTAALRGLRTATKGVVHRELGKIATILDHGNFLVTSDDSFPGQDPNAEIDASENESKTHVPERLVPSDRAASKRTADKLPEFKSEVTNSLDNLDDPTYEDNEASLHKIRDELKDATGPAACNTKATKGRRALKENYEAIDEDKAVDDFIDQTKELPELWKLLTRAFKGQRAAGKFGQGRWTIASRVQGNLLTLLVKTQIPGTTLATRTATIQLGKRTKTGIEVEVADPITGRGRYSTALTTLNVKQFAKEMVGQIRNSAETSLF